jgi:hypothetical protein
LEVGNMTQGTRIAIAVGVLLVVVAAVLGIEAVRRRSTEPTLAPGSIPIVLEGEVVAGFSAADLENLTKVSFIEPAENKTQEGWLLRDVILLYVSERKLKEDTVITVSSSSEDKSAQLTWSEVAKPANLVMFDLSNRGTLKLVSVMDKLDTRDEWVQDVDRIEIVRP